MILVCRPMILLSAKKILVQVNVVNAIFLVVVNDFGERKKDFGRC